MRSILLFGFILGSVYGKDWWENGNFYQIYPRSFKDSNNDGVGDIKGVTEKLEYLKDIGMTAAWLSPVFKSPMDDFGYDISDYYKIHYEYGTMSDFEVLTRKAKEVGVKIILDFVPNHTSDEHDWFKRSVKKDGKYTDYYIWHDGKPDEKNPGGRNKPPNNWPCEFRYSAWEWNDERQQYYYHQFGIKQPDLNYRNPDVVADMKKVLWYWLENGVSGFRIDAVPYLFEIEKDDHGNYIDEPVNPDCEDPDDYCSTIHIYTKDQPETFDMIYQWRELLDDFKRKNGGDSALIMTEAYTSLNNIISFYGDGIRNGSHVPFNFELINRVTKDSNAIDVSDAIDSFLERVPLGSQPNWVLGNHDQKRLASRLGENRADLYNILLQTLPGIAVTYNGEEISMKDVFVPWELTVDPQGCNADPRVFNSYSRDPARTPFQWDSTKNSGFSNASTTWLPVSSEYKSNNVYEQERSPVSHLKVFKKLVSLRQEPSFQDGSYERKVIGNNLLIYKRELNGKNPYIIILNFGKTSENVNLNELFASISNKVQVVTSSVHVPYQDGDVIHSNNIIAYPEAGIVFESV